MTDTRCAGQPPVSNDLSQMWIKGWRRFVFPAFWLIYLGQTIDGVTEHTDGLASIVGYAIVVAFAAVYVSALQAGMARRIGLFWRLYATGLVLTVVELPFAHGNAFVFLVYLSVLTMATRFTFAVLIVVGYAAVAAFVPALVPAWDTGPAWDLGVTSLLVSLAMFGFFKIIDSNEQLASARAEVARLAAENERSRIARDLHDLLGHSLTTITVKAGLARRLAEKGEDERARTEIAEVEQLTRRTLGDVRAAVSAHRETTLVGELATGREVLRAANITGELPPTVAEVDPDVDELFGWAVREGITNVVRHSRASHLRITVGRRHLEIADNGRGIRGVGTDNRGNGLTGLQERIAALGGRLSTSGDGGGFTLRVDVPDPRAAAVPSSPATVRTR